jgi:hypothetical protein
MSDATASDAKTKKKRTKEDDAAICKQAVERYAKWIERERENIDAAYDDLKFRAGEQWDAYALEQRKDRPTLTINRIPQFIRQVTGDMRQMKPGIKTVPVDSRGDKDTAETIAGMIRYIENRSDAAGIYMSGADSQVSCGIGHWMVNKEYADGTTFNQELRIIGIDDQVAVACDPDAKLPMKEDAKWWIIPVDISRESFKEEYPDASVEDFDDADHASADGWFDQDFIRIAAYWVKKPAKRLLAHMQDGGTADLTDKSEEEREEIGKTAKRVERRDSFKVCRYLITAAHVLEETDWPGMDIPIVPCLGEEVKIGKRTVRHGLTRFARDPQRMVNYYSSAEAEVVALQPKAPWLATRKNVENNMSQWSTANTENHSVLLYTPDSANGNIPPQRIQPAVSSQGISEGLDRAVADMKGVIGIYDAGLGNKSNETSGKAIIARQREGDVGTYIYIDNWTRSIRRTGSILIGLIPHVYDTERMIRIMGEDGKVDLKWINKPVGLQVDPMNPMQAGKSNQEQKIENDVTVGAYDVVLEAGPSYSTKREEAKESMREFIQSAPETAPVIMDLVAKAQDWPMADEISKRLEAVAPPPVQKLIAKQKQERGEEEQPDPPSQGEQMQQAAAQEELKKLQLENAKLAAEVDKIRAESAAPQGDPADPMVPGQLQLQQVENQLAIEKGRREVTLADLKVEEQQLKNEKLRLELRGAGIEQSIEVENHEIDATQRVKEGTRADEDHQFGMAERFSEQRRSDESHSASMEQGSEAHMARIKQMSQKPKPEARP